MVDPLGRIGDQHTVTPLPQSALPADAALSPMPLFPISIDPSPEAERKIQKAERLATTGSEVAESARECERCAHEFMQTSYTVYSKYVKFLDKVVPSQLREELKDLPAIKNLMDLPIIKNGLDYLILKTCEYGSDVAEYASKWSILLEAEKTHDELSPQSASWTSEVQKTFKDWGESLKAEKKELEATYKGIRNNVLIFLGGLQLPIWLYASEKFDTLQFIKDNQETISKLGALGGQIYALYTYGAKVYSDVKNLSSYGAEKEAYAERMRTAKAEEILEFRVEGDWDKTKAQADQQGLKLGETKAEFHEKMKDPEFKKDVLNFYRDINRTDQTDKPPLSSLPLELEEAEHELNVLIRDFQDNLLMPK